MINKKIILNFVFMCAMFVFVWFSMAQVQLNPIYSLDRFQPSDKFHAGCENQLDVVFDLEWVSIHWINAILKYNNQDINIIKIAVEWEKENNLSYVIEEDNIIFNKLKSDNWGLDNIVFKLFFKWGDDLKTTNFEFVDGSYVLDDQWNMLEIEDTYEFDFDNVPECTPDISSPHVSLLFPDIKTGNYVALDSYFEFNIFDEGKWINKDSISISIDDMIYDLSNIEHKREWENLTIYPDVWLPLDSVVKVEILVGDKQVYGKSNIINKTYNLSTSKDLYLLNDIDPVEFRKLVNKKKYYHWSLGECDLLKKMYVDLDIREQKLLQSVAKRLSCGDITQVDPVDKVLDKIDQNDEDIWWDDIENKISILSMLGWMLFLFVSIISGTLCYRKK